jgi:hypothetical protein
MAEHNLHAFWQANLAFAFMVRPVKLPTCAVSEAKLPALIRLRDLSPQEVRLALSTGTGRPGARLLIRGDTTGAQRSSL